MLILKEYRGHIRNWQALCADLGVSSDAGRREREEGILLAAYKAWGTQMADHIYGMFALAIWDDEKQELFCLRDQFGTKPFYYYQTAEGGLLFGTYIRDILAQPGFEKELNEPMLQIYLSLTYAAGEETFFKGLKKLMPGHYLIWRADDADRACGQPDGAAAGASCLGDHAVRGSGHIEVCRYWAPSFHPDEEKSLEDWADEIHTTLQHIMTEVKTDDEKAESFLSGGVDSSYVLAMSDAAWADTCGYEEARFDESPLAAETAAYLGRGLNRLIVQPEDFFGIVPFVMENMEQPLADASAIVFTLGCRAAAGHTKLCYSGEGSDEFFGGYNMYRNAGRYGDDLRTFYVGNTNIMKEDEKERILLRYDPSVKPIDLVRYIYEEDEGLDPLTKMSDVDIRIWLEGDIYLNVDKMSTANGLEIRMPLTDRRIQRAAASIAYGALKERQ